ncbi:DUF155-domain-containing protein [Teratosphaeria nubilosa]|uniref:DUF155-domain-containing protein n=1 Tax=Teratosphaeria nubilosa TaxID=161662 RepID=A0A6G1LCR4_9PEZI|nr:DUF155-domain-containing protein [Teratosphaeria nubilosa]
MSVEGPRGPAPKRGPTVLVTDAREPPRRPAPQARPTPARQGTRLISVDHVLQYASEIPSAQQRGPPGQRPSNHTRTPSGRHPLAPKLRGVGVPLAGGAHMPARSSKTSEKLVLLPETSEEGDEKEELHDDDDQAPPSDEALRQRRAGAGAAKGGKSDAERLPKSQRNAEAQLARVTAYCTAQSYRVKATAAFVRLQHGAKTKLYDDCLYCVYSLPLLGGGDGYRVRSSPVVKNPGGRSILDEQIEANERRQYREGWQEDSDEYSVQAHENPYAHSEDDTRDRDPEEQRRHDHDTARSNGWKGEQDDAGSRRESNSSGHLSFPSPGIGVNPEAYSVGELFVYAYGVVVFWNFTENQEKDILADLTFSSSSALHNTSSPSSAPAKLAQKLTGKKTSKPSSSQKLPPPPLTPSIPLMTRPLDEDDFETEDFHFQYDVHAEKPRIYNDMITLRTSDHMIKLAMSHAIGQSTKLSFFEERMQRTMAEAQYVPRRLALEGRLGMDRKEVVALVGRLFEQRVDVNLSSNMLDTPTFFWDSEPTLHPLYQAVREYLEIKPRIQVLNERCRVFLDLAEILSDSIADLKMTRITWIIIVLIVLSIAVTCTEVFLRFGILAKGKGGEGGTIGGGEVMMKGVGGVEEL